MTGSETREAFFRHPRRRRVSVDAVGPSTGKPSGGEEEEEEQCLVSSTDCGFDKAVLSICQGCRIACGVLFVSC